MRLRLLIVLIVVSTAMSVADARNARSTGRRQLAGDVVGESILSTRSILRGRYRLDVDARRAASTWQRKPNPLGLPALLIDDSADDDSGVAYIGFGSHTEPEVSADDALLPELPAAVDETAFSTQALQSQAVPLDGAAAQAEKPAPKEKDPADSRSSFAWIAGTGNQLGMLEWVDRDLAVFDYSLSDRTSMRIEPGFAMRWLTGPTTTDLPPYLFSIPIDIGAGHQVSDTWSIDMVISPMWNTDFANKSYTLFRLPWQLVNTFTLDDEWKLVLGVTDLDREDIHYLPVAGIRYKPLDGSKDFNLVFPAPKAAWRMSRDTEGSTWGYVAAELGGGSFSIQRPGAIHDIVTLRDYRLLFGWELRGEKRHATRIEAGWVFGRAVEYASGVGNYNPNQTAIIRLSSDY